MESVDSLEEKRQSLEREKKEQNRIKQNALNEKERLSQQLDRVRSVRKYIDKYKDDIKAQKDAIKKKVKETVEWTGNTRNDFCSMSNDYVVEKYTVYISNVDDVLDSICDLETSLENQITGQSNIITAAASAINWLGNEIRKLFN